MFCAFDGPPNIVRLHGRGRFVTLYDDGFDDLLALFDADLPSRAAPAPWSSSTSSASRTRAATACRS